MENENTIKELKVTVSSLKQRNESLEESLKETNANAKRLRQKNTSLAKSLKKAKKGVSTSHSHSQEHDAAQDRNNCSSPLSRQSLSTVDKNNSGGETEGSSSSVPDEVPSKDSDGDEDPPERENPPTQRSIISKEDPAIVSKDDDCIRQQQDEEFIHEEKEGCNKRTDDNAIHPASNKGIPSSKGGSKKSGRTGGELDIEGVTPNDVICGNEGIRIDRHPGNVYFRELINKYKPEYKAVPTGNQRRHRKKQIAETIIEIITKERGGRFFKKQSLEDGRVTWVLATEKQIHKKITTALSSSREYLSEKQYQINKKRKERNEQRILEALKLRKL